MANNYNLATRTGRERPASLIPLFIGLSIDGLLASDIQSLQLLAIVLVSITIISVVRRLYDTRAYGQIR